jgi:hypothetical protein
MTKAVKVNKIYASEVVAVLSDIEDAYEAIEAMTFGPEASGTAGDIRFEAREIKLAAERLVKVVAGLTENGLRNWRKANEDNLNRAILGA